MTSDSYGGYSQIQSAPDMALYQTPKRALSHQRFLIGGLILGAVSAFFINWGIGALLSLGKDRLFLYSFTKEFESGTETIKPSGMPIWFDLLLTVTLAIFLGTPINNIFIRGDLQNGKARAIQSHDLTKFRFFGVTLQNVWARALVFTIYGTTIVLPAVILILYIACNSNGMYRLPVPPDFEQPGECYLTKKMYILLKGLCAMLATTSVVWLVEWGSLNKDNLTEEVFDTYSKKVQEIQQEEQRKLIGQEGP